MYTQFVPNMNAWFVWMCMSLTVVTRTVSCEGQHCYLTSHLQLCDTTWALLKGYKHCTQIRFGGHISLYPTGESFLLLKEPYLVSPTGKEVTNTSVEDSTTTQTSEEGQSNIGISLLSSSSYPTITFKPEGATPAKEYHNFQIITGNNTYLSTPNFPSNYDNMMSLWFSIRPPDKLSRVFLTFTAFDLEPSLDCIADSVLLLGTSDPSPKCGSTIPSPIESLGNVLQIYFRSDSKTTGTGFEAFIQFLDSDLAYRSPAPGICESVNLHFNGSHYLKSPRAGHRNIQCGYIIHADVGRRIALKFHWFQLESCTSREENEDFEVFISSYSIPDVILGIEHEIDVETCLCDSLQIFDGFDAKATNLTERLCGFENPNINLTSTGNVMYIYLETDNEVRTGGFGINLKAV